MLVFGARLEEPEGLAARRAPSSFELIAGDGDEGRDEELKGEGGGRRTSQEWRGLMKYHTYYSTQIIQRAGLQLQLLLY